jgi:hypothetical protein
MIDALMRINRTLLSADKAGCQAHFFVTTFCSAKPLAKIVAKCSALRAEVDLDVPFTHYRARISVRSME